MLNYELAKDLRDAGFPQDGFGMPECAIEGGHDGPCEAVYLPTLSELIAACGGDGPTGFQLYQEWKTRDYVEWEATSGFGQAQKRGRGTTPEEAVARLWLALHEAHTPEA